MFSHKLTQAGLPRSNQPYTAGMTKSVRSVDVVRPNTTTTANGLSTSGRCQQRQHENHRQGIPAHSDTPRHVNGNGKSRQSGRDPPWSFPAVSGALSRNQEQILQEENCGAEGIECLRDGAMEPQRSDPGFAFITRTSDGKGFCRRREAIRMIALRPVLAFR